VRLSAVLAALLALTLLSTQVWGWAEPSFQFRREITVNPGSVSDLTGYQVNVTVDTQSLIAAGKMQSDCDDIRFYDVNDSVKLPYFIESGCNTKSTLIWVKLSSNYTRMYMYYGNPTAAGESNITQVFPVSDDFDGGALDTNRWYMYKESGVTVTVDQSQLRVSVNAGTAINFHILSKQNYSCDDCIAEAYIASQSGWATSGGSAHMLHIGLETNYSASTTLKEAVYDGYQWFTQDVPSERLRVYLAGAATDLNTSTKDYNPAGKILYIRDAGSTIYGGIRVASTGNTEMELSAPDSNFTAPYYLKLNIRGDSATGVSIYINWVRIRRTAATEPTVTISAEEKFASITVELRDEDTNEIISENATIVVYGIPDYQLYGTYSAENGTAQISIVKYPAMIVAWTNQSYTNQRRVVVQSPADITDKITIYLLKDGRGSVNYFNTYSATGVKVPQAEIRITWGGRVIDDGYSDSEGRFVSYLDPYKVYLVNASKEGYESNVTQFYGTGLTTHTVILVLKALPGRELVRIRFLPEAEKVPKDEVSYLWIVVDGWQRIDNITVLVFDDMSYLPLYRDYGITDSGRSEAYFFDLNDTDTSWCNATIMCFGNSTTVQWRVMPTALNDFGSTGRVYAAAFYYLADGSKGSHEAKMWIVKALTGIRKFISQLSSEQRMFIGLFIVLFVTGALTASFQLGFRQAGWIVAVLMVVNVVVGFWDKWLIIAPLVVFISLIAWRETM